MVGPIEGSSYIKPNETATYTVAGNSYVLLNHGDGFTAFDGAKIVADRIKKDDELLVDYVVDTLGGTVGEQYADPYGQGRITILQ